jgi:hypothetical protein
VRIIGVVFVEITQGDLRASLAAFLDAAFGGSVFDRDGGLELDFPVRELAPRVQVRIVERLLWAWSLEQQLEREIEVTLTAKPQADVEPETTIREALRLAP